jgi:hypothetical protein
VPFCPKCGKEVPVEANFCPSCGYAFNQVPPAKPVILPNQKNTGIAAVLALVLGIFGLMGVGHVYVGKIKRGIILLIIGIIFGILSIFSTLILLSLFTGFSTFGLGSIGAIIVIIIDLALWIWQTYDAYSLAKKYNKAVQETGKTPW